MSTYTIYDQDSMTIFFRIECTELEALRVVNHLREMTGLTVCLLNSPGTEADTIDAISSVYLHYFRLSVK